MARRLMPYEMSHSSKNGPTLYTVSSGKEPVAYGGDYLLDYLCPPVKGECAP